jgi:predicted lipoprotein with Yx(FWY)xxD motif
MKRSCSSLHRAWRAAGAGILVIAAAALAMTALASARSGTLTASRVHLTGPSGSRTETIVVNGRGVTVYWLGGETMHHLLCTSAACLRFWPPVKVSAGSRPKAAGFHGRVGTLRRHGFTQVTVNGHPVYTFLQDGGKRGVATGDGVSAFGGTWHVFKVTGAGAPSRPGSGSSGSPMPGPSSSTTSTSSSTTGTSSSTTSTSPYPGY